MLRRTMILFSVLLMTILAAGCSSGEKKPVPEENGTTAKYTTLMEAAADDPYPKGCVSCHKKTSDVDRSLAVYVNRIEGHPEVKESTITACYQCHEAGKNYERYKQFYRGMHEAHWKSTTFYEKSKGQCYSCHTVESNGVSGIKEYPVAGYRSAVGTSGGTSGQSSQQNQTNKQSGSQTEQKKTEQNQQNQNQQNQNQQNQNQQNQNQQNQQNQSQQRQGEQNGQTSQGNIPEDILPGIVEIPTPTP